MYRLLTLILFILLLLPHPGARAASLPSGNGAMAAYADEARLTPQLMRYAGAGYAYYRNYDPNTRDIEETVAGLMRADFDSQTVETHEPGMSVHTAVVGEARVASTAINAESWRLVTMQIPNEYGGGGGFVEIRRLMEAAELEALSAEVGGYIYLYIDELQIRGNAKVLSLEDCPAIEPGDGRVVVATYTHVNAHIQHLTFEGSDSILEPTAGHPFWSVDLQDYIPAADLAPGDRLLLANGSETTVATNTRQPGQQRVYNIEVEGDHRYFAGDDAVLVHNSYARLARRLGAFRAYKKSGGSLSMRRWVKATQGASYGTGYASGFRSWNRSLKARNIGNNAVAGKRWEDLVAGKVPRGFMSARQVTLDIGKSQRLRVDQLLRESSTGQYFIIEAKASRTAALSKRQSMGYEAITRGAVVHIRTSKAAQLSAKNGNIISIADILIVRPTGVIRLP